jgi:hypothetical protein
MYITSKVIIFWYSIATLSTVTYNSEVLIGHLFQSADFYNWNKVKIRYCDGASFSGNVKDEFQVCLPISNRF